MVKKLIVLFILFFSVNAFAADHYVRTTAALDATNGCANNGDGAAWGCAAGAGATGAYNAIPATLTRGDTYYIADGTYPGYTVNDAISGELVIYIKKATEAANSGDAGWASSLGDGTAIFTGACTIGDSSGVQAHVVWDGITNGGAVAANYGFYINPPSGAVCAGDGGTETNYATGRYNRFIIGVSWFSGYHNITVSNTAMVGCGSPVYTDQARLIAANVGSATNFNITYNYLADAANPILMRNWTASTISHNYFGGNVSGAGNYEHGQQISLANCGEITLSHNIFKNTAVVVTGVHKGLNHGAWYVFNNLIWGSNGTMTGCFSNFDYGADADRKDLLTGWKVYNNTLVNLVVGSYGLFWDDNTDAVHYRYWRNNLHYNVTGASGARLLGSTSGVVVHDHNYYNTVTNQPTAHTGDVTSIEAVTDLFIDYTNDNFRLKTGSEALDVGLNTSEITDIVTDDYFGTARPQNTVVDIGYFEKPASGDIAGTIVADNMTESTVVTGGATIIINIYNDTLVAEGATFNAARQAMIEGMDSDGAEAGGWDVEIKGDAAADVATVVRTDGDTITITLVAKADYAISTNETITVTIPASMLVTSTSAVVATPTFFISNENPVASASAGVVNFATGAPLMGNTTGAPILYDTE